MSEKIIQSKYFPRPLQEELHKKLKRFNVLVLHRRFGKSVFAVNEMKDKALTLEKFNPQYAYIAPTFGAAKRIAWDMFKVYLDGIPGVSYNETELTIKIERPWRGDVAKIWLLGAENFDAIRGIYLDGVVLDEYALMQPTIWGKVIRPILSDRLGWAIFISTPKGTNHFYKMWQMAGEPGNRGEWYRAMYRASDTGIISRKELESARRETSEEDYNQEFECDFFSANTGSYYGKYMGRAESSGRVIPLPYNRQYVVDTFWDIGVGDTTVIWFRQRVGEMEHIIDHLETSGVGLEYYVGELIKKNYIYGEHVFPHDMNVKEFGSGRTRIETLQDFMRKSSLGGRARVLPKHSLEDGINAVRMVLDSCKFDSEKCVRGIAALKSYSRDWDEKNAVFRARPKHDWASHSADAFRTFAMGRRNDSNFFGDEEHKSVDESRFQAHNDYDIFSYTGGS